MYVECLKATQAIIPPISWVGPNFGVISGLGVQPTGGVILESSLAE